MRTTHAGIPVLLALLLLGCGEAAYLDPGPWDGDPPDLPAGAPTPNCVTTDHHIFCCTPFCSPFKEAEVVVVARCTEIRQYEVVREGDYLYVWYVIAFDVIRVERGVWPHPRVAFCCYNTWPTPESGIIMDTLVFPFAEGRVMAMAIQPQAEPPPLLVGHEWRSRMPPHGKPRPLFSMMQSEEGKRLYDRLWSAARAFAEAQGWPEAISTSACEETDDAYVLEVILQTDGEVNRRAVAVDKETFAVREVP